MNTISEKPVMNPKAALFIIVFFLACNSVFFKLSTMPAMVFVSERFLISSVVFFVFLLISAKRHSRKLFEMNLRQFALLFFVGFVFSFGAYVYFIALKKTALTSVLILTSSSSVFVVIFSVIFLKDRLSIRSMLAIIMAFIGCIIVVTTRTNEMANSIEGNICALLCAIACATYMIFMKKFAAIPVPQKLFAVYTGSFAFAFAVALIQGHSFFAFENGEAFPAEEYLWVLGSAILSICIPQGVINWSLKWVKATDAGSINLLDPVIGSVYGYLIWGEGITMQHLIGGVCVIGGLYLYNRSEDKMIRERKEISESTAVPEKSD